MNALVQLVRSLWKTEAENKIDTPTEEDKKKTESPEDEWINEVGMRYFRAQELREKYATLRKRIVEIVEARNRVEHCVDDLRTEVMTLRRRYI